MTKRVNARRDPFALLTRRSKPRDPEDKARAERRKQALDHAARMRAEGKWSAAEALRRLMKGRVAIEQARPWATLLTRKAVGNATIIEAGGYGFVEIDWLIVKTDQRYWIIDERQRRIADYAGPQFNQAVKKFASLIKRPA